MMRELISRRLICVAYLTIIVSLTPACLVVSFVMWLFEIGKYPAHKLPLKSRRKILVAGDTATKAIHIIRILGKAGHTIVVADWRGCWSVLRWSKYVSKVVSVPSNQTDYIASVVRVAVEEKVDYFIPVIKKDYAMADAQIGEALSRRGIKCLVDDPQQIEKLDEKIEFMRMCKKFGLSVPPFIENEEDLFHLAQDGFFREKFFFLKPSACSSLFRNFFERIPDNVDQLRVFMERFPGETFFAQQFIKGVEWSANLISNPSTFRSPITTKSQSG